MKSDTSRFTGVVRARTESNLGFRVAGKIVERLVDPGDRVHAGQPLMRLDSIDFAIWFRVPRASRPKQDCELTSRKLLMQGGGMIKARALIDQIRIW
jgi:multidrug resistance efflux pump